MKNVSCEYDRMNSSNSTLQTAWYIYISFIIQVRYIWCFENKTYDVVVNTQQLHIFYGRSFARVLYFILTPS